MASQITRLPSELIPVTIGAVTGLPGDSTTVVMGERAGGLIHITALTPATAVLRFYSVPDPAAPDAFSEVRDQSNSPIEITVANNCAYSLPDELFAAKLFKIAAVGTTATAIVLLKT
jgi:hypothetical protein